MQLKKDRGADKNDCDENDVSELQTSIDALMLEMRLENKHRLNYAEENITDSITYRDIKNFIFDMIVAKFDA